MNKERVKSIILIVLISFNLVLAEKILVNKKLWPSGYNFFSIRTASKKDDYSIIENLAVPLRIIVNTGYQSSRFEYLRSSSDFDEIYTAADQVIKKAFSKPIKSVSSVSSDDWYSALTGKSLYLSYPCKFSAQNFADLIGLTSTEQSFKGFSDIVIGETGNVYISDTEDGSFYKIDLTSPEIAPIIEAVLTEESDKEVINYSFDLNFDKDFGDQKTFLSPMIPIYSAPVETEVIISSNPILRDGETNQKAIDGILDAFSINPRTVWRYTEADGSLVFVENTGVLKISPDGILSFTATGNGISLSTSSQNSRVTASDVARLVGNVNRGAGCDTDMYITSPLTSDSVTELTFDYIVNGIPVRFNDTNAASITVENGCITGYTQILRRYTPAGYSEYSSLYIEALDNIIAKYRDSMSRINIIKMFPAYIDTTEMGEKFPDWFIEIDNVIAE